MALPIPLQSEAFLDTAGLVKKPWYDFLKGSVTPSFSAHRNGVAQGGIVPSTPTKVLFTTERWDRGGFYDATTGTWTPPAGRVALLTAHIGVDGTNITSGDALHIWLYKGGVQYEAFHIIRAVTTTGSVYASGSCWVETDGTALEPYIECAGSGNLNINGIARDHHWGGMAF